MSHSKKNVPKRRFKEFNNADAWEQHKLRDFTKISQGLQIAISDRYLENGDNRELYITNEFLNTYSSPKYYIEDPPENVIANEDDILMTRTGNTGKVITNVIGAFHNNFFKIDYNPMKTSKLFLYYVLVSENIQKEILIKAGTSTIPDLNHNDFYSIVIQVPKIQEQQKIGDFFKQLDNTIALHQRKLEKIKALKTAYLSEMFPAEGETKPKRRFAGFTDDWEQRKLEDILDVRSGRDYKHLDSGDIPVYGTGGYMLSVGEALSYEEDAIGIGRKGTIDKPYILKAPFWTVDTLFYTVPKRDSDLNFIHSIFQKINWKSKDESTGVPSLSKTTINAVSVFTPSCSEQKEIGTFFNKLDDTIALHQRKLQKLQNIKKAYLNEMFI
ncbi:restriction endonuclease subunit S [Listeria monocytogenes]|nr:restriction endonuclease subunit S [Listeria monocytogenes]EAD6505080.1 restriction endonuclease subunit S [Listeria monocytogenes]